MSQLQRLERCMEIDRRIRNGQYPNPNHLAEHFGVSRRAIFDDRTFMIDRMGAPIKFNRDRNGWYYTDETWSLASVIVTDGELLAFFLSVEISKRYLGTGLEKTLRSAVEKLSKTIKGAITVDLETLRSHYSFSGPSLLVENEQALIDLHHAIADSRRVWMRYYTASRNEHTERVVHPYHLNNIRGDWYLVAYDEFRQEFRSFSIGRIEDWKLQTEKFKRDPEFSIIKYMGSAFQSERGGEPVDVVIQFAPQAARYIREKHWHDTQTIEELADGGLFLRFKTGGLGEVKRWVLQYGGDAEVIAPEGLRDACREETLALAKIYKVSSKNCVQPQSRP